MTDCLTHFPCTNGGDKYVISSADSTCLSSGGLVRCLLELTYCVDDKKNHFVETFDILHYWNTFLLIYEKQFGRIALELSVDCIDSDPKLGIKRIFTSEGQLESEIKSKADSACERRE